MPSKQGRSDVARRPTGCRFDQGLYQLVPTSLQKARQQKLSEYLPSFVHSSPVEYSVRLSTNDVCVTKRFRLINLFRLQAECH